VPTTGTGGTARDAGTTSVDPAPVDAAATEAAAPDGAGAPLPPIGSRLSFTDWYVSGLKGNADGAFAFASRVGLNGVEVNPEYDGVTPRLMKAEVRKQYFDVETKYGLKISSFSLGELWVDKLATDPSAVDKIKNLIDVCVLMDVHTMLLPSFINYDSTSATDTMVERLKTVAPKAEASGVVLGIENYLNGERNATIIKRVGSPAVKIYYDIGNSATRGFDVPAEIRMLKDSIVQFHVKDYSGLFGKAKIDFTKFKQALYDIDYHGWLILELEPGMVQPLSHEAGYKYDADYLRKLFATP
jgi:sugar phosphate isomerase/epimerase